MSITEHLPRTALLDKLWARMNERGDFPLLSESLRATMAAMKNDDLDFTALVRVVLSDFALTHKVLRLANSAMYMAFGGNITTVTRALMVLGMDTVGHLVVGLKLVDHFHHSTLRRIDAKLELNRALLSGCVARKLTEHAQLRGGEEAVVCTLMRQVGKLLVVCYLDSEWDRIRRRAAELNGDEAAACVDVLGVGFETIGLEAAASWRLPAVIRAAAWGFGLCMALLAVLALSGPISLPAMMALLFAGYGFLGLVLPTTAVLSLERHGEIAGAASALMGALQMGVGSAIMALAGLYADGTPRPMVLGIAACALGALALTLWVLRPHPLPDGSR